MDVYNLIAETLHLQAHQVKNTIALLNEGATIPFISRYRKERTGNLDETLIEEIKNQNDKFIQLDKRKEAITASLVSQGKFTDEMKQKIASCPSLNELEDIYLPFRPKRTTKAEIAKKKGLSPLAATILLQRDNKIELTASKFINKEVESIDEALKGARDIIAEVINEDDKIRAKVRTIFARKATITSKVIKGKEEEAIKYKDYFDCSQQLGRCSSHRLLAMRRGESEGFLRVSISCDEEEALNTIERMYIHTNNECARQLELSIKDSYKRLLKPSIENEFAISSKQNADIEAIKIFSKNLQQLLLSPPLGQKIVMGIDPGYRTGCKVVCLNREGNFIVNTKI